MRIKHVLVLMVLVLSSCGQVTDSIGSIGKSKLQAALESCADTYSGHIEVLDDGKTLSIDGKGEEHQGATFTEIDCVLSAIPVPSYVTSRMDQTRALDGMQREKFDTYDISWSYHPDNGLDIVIHEQ